MPVWSWFAVIWLTASPAFAATTPPVTTQSAATTQPSQQRDLFGFYATNLRASLFSGCLTLGSFLLAVNTFIIVNLKKEVFEHDLYKKRVREHRKSRPDYAHYGPLRNLSRALFCTIVFAFTSSVLQITMGMLWQNAISAMICIVASILVGVGVFIALSLVGIIMKDWFDFLEKAVCAEHKRAAEEEKGEGHPTE